MKTTMTKSERETLRTIEKKVADNGRTIYREVIRHYSTYPGHPEGEYYAEHKLIAAKKVAELVANNEAKVYDHDTEKRAAYARYGDKYFIFATCTTSKEGVYAIYMSGHSDWEDVLEYVRRSIRRSIESVGLYPRNLGGRIEDAEGNIVAYYDGNGDYEVINKKSARESAGDELQNFNIQHFSKGEPKMQETIYRLIVTDATETKILDDYKSTNRNEIAYFEKEVRRASDYHYLVERTSGNPYNDNILIDGYVFQGEYINNNLPFNHHFNYRTNAPISAAEHQIEPPDMSEYEGIVDNIFNLQLFAGAWEHDEPQYPPSLADHVTNALIQADNLFWAIEDDYDKYELQCILDGLIVSLKDIATKYCSKKEPLQKQQCKCPEIEDSKKALDDFFDDDDLPF